MAKKENVLIAKFIGIDVDEDPNGFFYVYKGIIHYIPKYNMDWNLLMPIVEKIESLGYDFIINGFGSESHALCQVLFEDNNHTYDIHSASAHQVEEDYKLGLVYKCVVEFIKVYNSTCKIGREGEYDTCVIWESRGCECVGCEYYKKCESK